MREIRIVRAGGENEPLEVEFLLRRGLRIRGRLLDQDGVPVAGVAVEFHRAVRSSFSKEAFRPAFDAAVQARGEGASNMASARHEMTFEQYTTGTTTGDDGRFECDILGDGEIHLLVRADGFRPALIAMGSTASLAGDAGDDERVFRVERVPPEARARLLVTSAGQALAPGTRLLFSDLSRFPMEFARWLTVEEDGRVHAESLAAGSDYGVMIRGSREAPRHLAYAGQASVALDDLEDAREFMNRR